MIATTSLVRRLLDPFGSGHRTVTSRYPNSSTRNTEQSPRSQASASASASAPAPQVRLDDAASAGTSDMGFISMTCITPDPCLDGLQWNRGDLLILKSILMLAMKHGRIQRKKDSYIRIYGGIESWLGNTAALAYVKVGMIGE